MQRLSVLRGSLALAAILLLIFLPGCGGGGNSASTTVTSIVLTPSTISLNEGGVQQLSAIALNAGGQNVPADITFTSSDANIATVSTGGLICGGIWDSSIINCNAKQGTSGVGKVTITATATAFNVSSTTTVYVHERVDQVQAVVAGSCNSMGKPVTISGRAFSTSAPGCSPSAPCDITSTVGPFSFGTNNATIAASSSGIQTTYSASTNTPVYLGGGTISGSKGQTCNLTDFNGVFGATATVTLTGKNAIAANTQLNITASGYGATTPPTSATLGNGSATCSGTAAVQTAITSGVMTAQQPGITTLFASVSGVNSVGVNYTTCPVASIAVHATGGSQTSFTLTPPNTQGLTADVLDSAGQAIEPKLTWGSAANAAATVAATGSANGATVTSVSGGATDVTATCSYPDCNIGLPAAYSENVAHFTINSSVDTTVYAASSNSKMLVPISTNGNAPAAAITLPYYPNSIIADPAGKAIYLGSANGLMAIASGSTSVSTFPAKGNILAISPDGTYMLLSDSVNNQIQYFSVTGGVVLDTKTLTTANSSAYTPDSKYNEWVNATTLAFNYPGAFLFSQTPDTAPSFLDFSGQGGLSYVTSASGAQIYVVSTCDASAVQTLHATAPTLIKGIPKGTGAVAVDPPSIDVISTPSPVNAGCPVSTQSTLNAYDLGVGSFTPTQLLITTDSSTAWILASDLTSAVSFNLTSLAPQSVALTGGATPLSGGLTLDGTQLWVGTSDNRVHRIDTSISRDVAQVVVNLKDANGNVTPANLVAVLP